MYSKSLSFFSKPLKKTHFVSTLIKTPPIARNLEKIYKHPFNQQLFDGSLNPDAFGYFLHDDYIYLHHYALILKKIATRASKVNPKLSQQLAYLHSDIISGEQRMQERYKKYFTHTETSQPGVAISSYIEFLKEKSLDSEELPVSLCSIFPCFWIYYQLGTKKLAPSQLVQNPYKDWIKTYSNATFVEATLTLADTIDVLALESTTSTQIKMKAAFAQSVGYELQFFDESNSSENILVDYHTAL
ncbi:TenA family protein [Legionella saoudiensis]|uniref:TenA family protein n=1 Tax=Legionella saoudiensis TaxID=1750561 RepID=UPI0007318B51|nr:TenA family protein [Legionella saoudiensis]